jgi:hypothetical protein
MLAEKGSSMATLVERLGVDPVRDRVVADCVQLIDTTVKSKGGVGGIALRASYATIKTIKRGFVVSVVEALLDDWLGKLQPHHDKWSSGGGGGTFAEFLTARSDDVAEDLLAVTDERAEKTSHTTAKKAYLKMRGGAKKNVIETIPDLGKLIEKHLAEAPAA